ncbi:glycoside hydrolase/deacetylase [Venturia nashicola]|uniref:Glycoside hydrolase/deacetylase n=1 Tax=Venturia nashicola TaxID=86259 RepID=A0A4Z1PD24_9PEZI|nr:glycoside hydrolase/deacetylase [Venturia nashicola]
MHALSHANSSLASMTVKSGTSGDTYYHLRTNTPRLHTGTGSEHSAARDNDTRLNTQDDSPPNPKDISQGIFGAIVGNNSFLRLWSNGTIRTTWSTSILSYTTTAKYTTFNPASIWKTPMGTPNPLLHPADWHLEE